MLSLFRVAIFLFIVYGSVSGTPDDVEQVQPKISQIEVEEVPSSLFLKTSKSKASKRSPRSVDSSAFSRPEMSSASSPAPKSFLLGSVSVNVRAPNVLDSLTHHITLAPKLISGMLLPHVEDRFFWSFPKTSTPTTSTTTSMAPVESMIDSFLHPSVSTSVSDLLLEFLPIDAKKKLNCDENFNSTVGSNPAFSQSDPSKFPFMTTETEAPWHQKPSFIGFFNESGSTDGFPFMADYLTLEQYFLEAELDDSELYENWINDQLESQDIDVHSTQQPVSERPELPIKAPVSADRENSSERVKNREILFTKSNDQVDSKDPKIKTPPTTAAPLEQTVKSSLIASETAAPVVTATKTAAPVVTATKTALEPVVTVESETSEALSTVSEPAGPLLTASETAEPLDTVSSNPQEFESSMPQSVEPNSLSNSEKGPHVELLDSSVDVVLPSTTLEFLKPVHDEFQSESLPPAVENLETLPYIILTDSDNVPTNHTNFSISDSSKKQDESSGNVRNLSRTKARKLYILNQPQNNPDNNNINPPPVTEGALLPKSLTQLIKNYTLYDPDKKQMYHLDEEILKRQLIDGSFLYRNPSYTGYVMQNTTISANNANVPQPAVFLSNSDGLHVSDLYSGANSVLVINNNDSTKHQTNPIIINVPAILRNNETFYVLNGKSLTLQKVELINDTTGQDTPYLIAANSNTAPVISANIIRDPLIKPSIPSIVYNPTRPVAAYNVISTTATTKPPAKPTHDLTASIGLNWDFILKPILAFLNPELYPNRKLNLQTTTTTMTPNITN